MIFIFEIISIIIQKNTLCTNKFCVIYFCPNCVNFLTENANFFILFYLFIFFFLGGGEGGDWPHCLPARAPMMAKYFMVKCVQTRKFPLYDMRLFKVIYL